MSNEVVAVTIPAVGVAMTEAAVLRWLVAVGDTVTEGQHVAEIETDKVVMELESPASGVVDEILLEPGVNVGVNVPIATIRVGSEDAPVSAGLTQMQSVAPPPPTTAPAPAVENVMTVAPPAQPGDAVTAPSSSSRRPFVDPPRVRFADRHDSQASAAPVAAALPVEVSPLGRGEGAPSWAATAQMSASGVERKLHAARQNDSGTVVTYTDLLISLLARAAVHTFVDRTVITSIAAFGFEPGALEYREVTDAASLSPEAISRSRSPEPDKHRPAPPLDALHLVIVNAGPNGPDAVVPPAPTSANVVVVGIGSIAPRVIALGGGVAIRTTVYMTICAQPDRTTAHHIARFALTIREKLNE